ncbi:MAG: hypothetical protein IJO68_06935 [Clostridia bacterium]|nr:hypothetical protein [Clostridia bacterium]
MDTVFLKILNMSISSCWIVLVVILLRFVLKKAPKWINCVLWGIAGLRLILPFSLESIFSLIPSPQTLPQEVLGYEGTQLQQPAVLDVISNPIFSESISVDLGQAVDRVQLRMTTMTAVWLFGIAVLLIYTLISYLRLKRKVGTAVKLRDNIYQSENVVSPFVLGLIKPKIYLPFNISTQDMNHVISHEQAHISRKDYLWKPLGFLILTLHWFNPLVWVGYILLCRDIELACDEKVVKELNNEQRADYSEALLTCSVNRKMIAACPLAFGEVGVKNRVKSVLNYKKPAFWIIVIAIIVSIAVAVCFLTNPLNSSVYNSRYETGKCLYSYVVSADKETKSNELVFDITSDGKVYKTFGDGTTEELGVLKESDYTAEELKAAMKNQDKKLRIGNIKNAYELSNYIFLQKSNGNVYLVQFFSDGRIMSVFKLNRIDKSNILNGSYKLSKETAFNVSLIHIPHLENNRIEIKTTGGMHIYHFTGEVLSTGALYEEVKLNKENISSLLDGMPEWSQNDDLKNLIKNNKEAWFHKTVDDIYGYPYMLLSQKDGTLYMIFADFKNGEPENLRYVYKLEYKGNYEAIPSPLGSFKNPYNIGDSARIKHGDINQKDVVYDYNASITRILTGKEAEEMIKKIASNYEEEKEALESFDLYLARVHIKYNEESTVKDRLPTAIGASAVSSDGQHQFIDPRFNITDNSSVTADGEYYGWFPVLASKTKDTCWISITTGTYQGAPGIISDVCFALPPDKN